MHFFVAGLSFSSRGQSTWNGNSGANWNTAANWTPSGVPTRQTDVIIPNGRANYPTSVSGAQRVCRNLTFNTGGTGAQNRLGFAGNTNVQVFGTFTNNYESGVLGTNGRIRMMCNTTAPASPTAVSIVCTASVNTKFKVLTIEKACASYTATVPSGSNITITESATITGTTLDVQGNMYLEADLINGTTAIITAGVAGPNVHVRAIVGNADEGARQRYHYLGNPTTDNKPYEHLDLDPSVNTIDVDFSLSDQYVASSNDWGHHMYNPKFSYPEVYNDVGTDKKGSFHLNATLLPASAQAVNLSPLVADDNEPFPRYTGGWIALHASYASYLTDLDLANKARTSQVPYMQYWDESMKDPTRPTTSPSILTGEAPLGTYGFKGIVDNTTTFQPLQGMLANFGVSDYGDRNSRNSTPSERSDLGYIDWKGTVNNGTVSINLTRTNNGETDQDGWQLLGNPYPSQMDLRAFYLANSTNISNVFQFFDGNVGDCSGCGTSSNVDVNATSDPYPVQIGQGFWVRLLNTGTCTLTTNNTHRLTADQSTRILRKAVLPANALELGMATPKMGMDKLTIKLGDGKVVGFKEGEDAVKRLNFTNSFYAFANEYRVSTSALPAISETPVMVDLGMILETDETVTLSAPKMNLETNAYQIMLHDKVANKKVEVKQGFSYSFKGQVGQTNQRFALEFLPKGYEEKATGIPIQYVANYTEGALSLFANELSTGEANYSINTLAGIEIGKGAMQFESGKGSLKANELPAGIYLISIQKAGRPVSTTRFVVAK